ncbi:hypothetical protein THUN1656_04100 [Rodentibacter abscessus]
MNPGDNVNFNAGSGLNVKVEVNGNNGFNVTYALANTTANVIDGKANVTDGNAVLNGTQVADLVNNASFNITTAKNNDDIDESKNDRESTIKAGDKITYIAGNNLEVKKEGSNITYALSRNVNVTENLTVKGNTTLGNLAVRPNSTINMGDNIIHNVSAGVADTDAVNVSQLKDTISKSKTEVKAGDGISVAKTANGTADVYTVSVNNTTGSVNPNGNVSVANKDNYLKAGEVEKLVNGTFWKLGDNNGTVKHNVTAGNQVDFVNGKGTTSVVTQEANGKNSVSFDVKVDDTTTKIIDGNVSVATGDISPISDLNAQNAGKVEFNTGNGAIAEVEDVANAINGSGWITNTTNGDKVMINPGDAVNYVDGKNTKANVTKNANGGVDVTYDVDISDASHNITVNKTNDDVTSTSTPTLTEVKPSNTIVYAAGKNLEVNQNGHTITYGLSKDISVDSIGFNKGGAKIEGTDSGDIKVSNSTGGPAKITNVAAGEAPTDAVNVSQLNKVAGKLENKIGRLDGKINKNKKQSNAGIASVAAMANIPQVFIPGKSGVGVGVGARDGQSAIAVGYSRASDNGKHIIKFSAGMDSQSKSTFGAGYMYQW